jgi:hypothetical protein
VRGRGDPGSGEDFREAFARIEAAVDRGEAELASLGFWRLLREVKADPTLSQRWADQAGRIDRRAFEARVKLRFPMWFGNLVLVLGTAFGAAAIVVALRVSNATAAGIGLIVAALAWSVSLHDLAHWAVGRLVGIRFICYFLGGPFPPRPGLKIDYATYLRTDPGSRAWMHASGAVATKVAPFVALGFWWTSGAPGWGAWVVVIYGILQIVTDVLFSTKSSDWKKVKRERRIARSQAWRSA